MRIMMADVTQKGNVVEIDFKVNHHLGGNTFVAVAGKSPDIEAAKHRLLT